MLRGFLVDEWDYIFSGGHYWAKMSVGICLKRGHDVFMPSNAYCYNCKRHYDLGRDL